MPGCTFLNSSSFAWHFSFAGLYTTFIFQKPDPDIAPPLMTPVQDAPYIIDEVSILKFAKNTLKLGLGRNSTFLISAIILL